MSIDWARWLTAGLAATIVLTTISSLAQGFGLTRMSVPWLLGSMATPDRDHARVIGTLIHFLNGWIFSLVHVLVFEAVGGAVWWQGAIQGAVHAVFVLAVVLPILPIAHPRMAGPHASPMGIRRLEPPGFLALHYGKRTPLAVLVSHTAFGLVLAILYGN